MKCFNKAIEMFVVGIAAIFLTTTANATLELRLGGKAVYDSNKDITWLADPSAASPNVFDNGILDNDGRVTYANAVDWLTNLNVSGITNWKTTEEGNRWYNPGTIPTQVDFLIYELLQDPSFSDAFGGHQSYWAVGAALDCAGTPCPGPFVGVEPLAINFHLNPINLNTSSGAYDTANLSLPTDELRILAMHDGDVFAQIPEPGIIVLLSVGLIGLIIQQRKA